MASGFIKTVKYGVDDMRKIILAVILMVFSLLGVTFYYWYSNANYVKTEDAKVDGAVIKVSSQAAGKIIDVNAGENEEVKKGQSLAQLDNALLPGTNPETAIIRAPMDGVIIKKMGNAGEVISPGQPIFMMTDPQNLYITANIEETKLSSIKPGQRVDVWLDAVPGKEFSGEIDRIAGASLSTFSMLPLSNTSSGFTKVVQRVPVSITLDYNGYKLMHGTSAKVRIHIK